MNKVVVIMVKPLEFLPPVMALLHTLRSIGREPVFVGVQSAAGDAFLKENRFESHYIEYDRDLYLNDTLWSKVSHRIVRARRFYPHRRELANSLVEIEGQYGHLTLWFVEVQSAALLGNRWKFYDNRVVSIYELADFCGRSWLGFSFYEFIRTTVLVEPEFNRAREIQRHFGLSRIPMVVANKPACHPRKYIGALPERVKGIVDKANGRPIFLYQGVWTEDRQDVGVFIETIARNRENYCVVVMPGTGCITQLAQKYSNVFLLDYMPPPYHLAATSVASVGIAVYNPSGKTDLARKNALFCAPNKIYEYAGFGVPTLGNRVPGLIDTVEQAGAGICVDVNESAILAGADRLIENLVSYRVAANKFFDDTDLGLQVESVLKETEKL